MSGVTAVGKCCTKRIEFYERVFVVSEGMSVCGKCKVYQNFEVGSMAIKKCLKSGKPQGEKRDMTKNKVKINLAYVYVYLYLF